MLRTDSLRPWFSSRRRLECGRTVLKVWKTENSREFLFRFYDGVEFIIDEKHGDIWFDGRQSQAATYHLLFLLPGFLLALRKAVCLRGAVIGWEDGAIALLGHSCTGKSMLSVTMEARGVHILSDDLVALHVNGGIMRVYPGYPWISLRPESLHWLGTNNFDVGRLRSKWNYLDEVFLTWDLRPCGRPFQSQPRKLQAIYLLAPAEDPGCEPAIESIPQYQALMGLMDHSHVPYPEFKPQEFERLGSVVATVPTNKLRYHLSRDSLTAITDLLLSQI